MAEARHHLQSTTEGIHTPFHWTWTNSTVRLAEVVIADDVGKIGWQQDDDSVWLLTAVTPTWVQIDGGGVVGGDPYPFGIISVDDGGDADYTDLATAVAAASSGQVVVVGPGTYTLSAALSVGAGIGIVGAGVGITTISCTTDLSGSALITLGAGSFLENVSVSWTNVSTTASYGILVNGADAWIKDIAISLSASGGGSQQYTGIRFSTSGKALNTNSTVTVATAASTWARGIWIFGTGSGSVEVIGGRYNASGAGTNYDMVISSNPVNTVLQGAIAVNGNTSTSGTIAASINTRSGWFLNGGTPQYLRNKQYILIDISRDEATALTTGTSDFVFRTPAPFIIEDIIATVTTAPTDADIIVDINEGGVSIFSTRISIDATEKTSTTATTPYVLTTAGTIWATPNTEITFDIDQVGSTVAGAGLKIWLIGYTYFV